MLAFFAWRALGLNNDYMKHTKPQKKTTTVGRRLSPVRFEFTHPTASTVCIAGTFNDWHAKTKPMYPLGGGLWQTTTSLPPGTYEYCLVVDGEWMPDPHALEAVPNPFGGRNSLLQVPGLPGASHLADAEHLPLKNANNTKETKYGQRNTSGRQ